MRSNFDGPLIITGNINPSQSFDGEQGPSVFFQGTGILDPRYAGLAGAAPGLPGYPVPAFAGANWIKALDITPATASATALAALQNITNGTALTLAANNSAAIVVSMPFVPQGSAWVGGNKVTAGITLDFGFTLGSITAAASALTVTTGDGYKFFPGQKIVICGASSTTVPQVVTVKSVAGDVVTIYETATATLSSGRVGCADPQGIGAWPYMTAGGGQGAIALLDPAQIGSRVVSVTSSAAAAGSTFTVVGYDMYGNKQTEAITVGANTIAYGKKAFKHIISITPNSTEAQNYSAGFGDVFGLPIRSDFFENTAIDWIAACQTANTGWLVADVTSPATTTTGDPRGTIQLGTLGGGTGYTTSPNGTRRLAVQQSLGFYQNIAATYLSYAPLFGVTPV